MFEYIVPGLLGAGQSLLESQLSKRATQQSHLAAEQAEDRAWDRQTNYNHPSQQMARLREAGLNPNLVYGQGAQGATGTANASIHQRNPYSYQDKIQNFLSNQLMLAQARSLNAETNYKEYELDNLRATGSTRVDSPVVKTIQYVTKPIGDAVRGYTNWAKDTVAPATFRVARELRNYFINRKKR